MVAYPAEKLQPYDSQEGIEYIDFDWLRSKYASCLLVMSQILSDIVSFPPAKYQWKICER